MEEQHMSITTEGNTFDSYACIGDTVERESDKYRLVARLEFDHDTTPDEFDCYDDEDTQAWKDNEWCYVGIVIGASYDGITLDDHLTSCWGYEMNLTDNTWLTTEALRLMEESMEEAEELRKDMTARLAA